MRFSAVHKVSSYLMVGSAFLVLALSGELPPVWLAFTIGAGLASFFVEPSRMPLLRTRGWTRAWNVATLLVFAWAAAEAVRGDALVMVGVRFLCFLLVNKLWNRRTSKDYQQAYVVSFLMLVAGTTLNTELAYAFCFLAYVAFATWTLTLFHLRREMEENYLLKHSDDAQSERVEVERILNSRRVVGPSFLAGTSLVSIGIFIVSATIFFLFPRVGFGLFFGAHRSGMRMGFNDTGVELGQNGLIKDNDQVVMRIEFPDGKPPDTIYLRGIAFEHYERGAAGRNAGWTPAVRRGGRRELRRPYNGIAVVGSWSGDARATRQVVERGLRQEIYLEPMGDVSVLFAASRPIGVRLPPPKLGAMPTTLLGDSLDDIIAGERGSGAKYTAYSDIKASPPALLDGVPDLAEEEREDFLRALELPPDLSPRVAELARSVTRDARGPHQKILALTRYLGANYRYTTSLGRDARFDPLEDFLFVQKAGHCEYFATALAILLRVVGVPTRHVAGFLGGEWNAYGGYLQVRQRDAHAWVEAWLGDAGWVMFDPTPASFVVGDGGFADRVRQMLDTVQLAWFKYVIEYDLGKQVDIFQGVRKWLSGGELHGTRTGIVVWARAYWRELASLLGVALLALALWRLRRRGAGGARRVTHRRHRATSALERALRALERRGLTRAPAETPAELAVRAEAHGDPGAASFRALVDLYYGARFGGWQPVDSGELDRLVQGVVRAAVPPSQKV